MRKVKLAIWGTSGHACVVYDSVLKSNTFTCCAFIDDVNQDLWGKELFHIPVMGGRKNLNLLRQKKITHIIVGVGDCDVRMALAQIVMAERFQLATVIHPSATFGFDVKIGVGVFVAAGVVINPRTSIGDNVIVNTSVSIDHDNIIEEGVHLSPGVHTGGSVRIGKGSWIGLGSSIKNNINIGSRTLVGAGSLVIRDLPSHVVAYGTPARIVKEKNVDG